MKKAAIFPAIVSVLTFAAFWICWWVYVMVPVKPLCFAVLPFLLPAVIFAVIAWKGKHAGKTAVVTGILLPVCLIGALAYGVLLQLQMATTPVTEICYYERAVKRVAPASFPETVPEDAAEVLFEYLPAFLQGGEELTLAFTTNEAEAWLEAYSQQANAVYDEEAPPPEIPYLGDTVLVAGEALAGDYVICLLSAVPYMEDNWNHGELLAVKIDVDTGWVIIMYRDW